MRTYKFTDAEVKLFTQTIAAANRAAEVFAEDWLEKALERGPAFSVHEHPFGGEQGPAIGHMLDVCGNAYIRVTDMRTRFAKWLVQEEYYEACRQGRTYYKPQGGYYGGVRVPITYKHRCRQEMGLHEAAVSAARGILELAGLKVTYKSYID